MPSRVVWKRLAEKEDMPLRSVKFDDVCRTSSAARQHFSFADLEVKMCVSSVLRVDVAEDDRTVPKSVPESTTADGAAIHTDVCDGGL